jgi:hypothetical protein
MNNPEEAGPQEIAQLGLKDASLDDDDGRREDGLFKPLEQY